MPSREDAAVPSPFPGMNPYIETAANWRGFHTGILYCLQAAITPLVVPRYHAEIEESLYIDRGDESPTRAFAVADIGVTPRSRKHGGAAATAVATAPVRAVLPMPRQRAARRLVIRDGVGRRVVTVIEFLSPTNKAAGDGRDRYLDKRAEVLGSDASLIEIDLLRGGTRLPAIDLPPCDYYLLVSRPADRPNVDVWPTRVRDVLPPLPIPLRPGEPEPTVNLKTLIERVYDETGLAHTIYARPPHPPLSAEDAAWAAALVPTPSRAAP